MHKTVLRSFFFFSGDIFTISTDCSSSKTEKDVFETFILPYIEMSDVFYLFTAIKFRKNLFLPTESEVIWRQHTRKVASHFNNIGLTCLFTSNTTVLRIFLCEHVVIIKGYREKHRTYQEFARRWHEVHGQASGQSTNRHLTPTKISHKDALKRTRSPHKSEKYCP